MAESEVSVEEKKTEKSESPNKKTQSLEADAFHNFLQGKRHLLVQDYAHAVESLADACELYVKHYGETAVECGEVYYHYGVALFRLFQQQAGILGDVLPDGSEEEDEDDEDDEEEEGNKSDSEEDKEKENADSNSNDNEGEEPEEEDLVDEDEDSKKEEANDADKNEAEPKVAAVAEKAEPMKDVSASASVDSKSASDEAEVGSTTEISAPSDSKVVKADSSSTEGSSVATDKQGPSSSTDISEAGPSTSQPKPKSEDISDLQLAWETLETAKSIFKRKDSREAELKVADILIILAEISMELENYASAVDDLQECLHIREHMLSPDDRSIAETYYQLALAYTYDSQVKPAIENYEKSMQVIQLRIENLKNQTEVKKTPEGFDIDPQVEIEELEGLLPEIKAKMEDTHDMMQDARKVVKEMAFQKVEEVTASSPEKPVTNISHLLKRKKPEDSSDTAKPNEVKKIKLVSAENGDAGTSEMSSTENASPPKA